MPYHGFKNVKLLSYDKKIIMIYMLSTECQWVNFEACFKFSFP
jgi:hypothetical protein